MNVKHGLYKASEYNIYMKIKYRCLVPTAPEYPLYGGRGINLCERWANSFPNFIEDIGRRPSPKHSVDRINNDKGYSPDNCRWALPYVQLFNRRIMKSNTSGITGVRFNNRQDRWIARIGEDGTYKHLGSFKTKDEAVNARLAAQQERLTTV